MSTEPYGSNSHGIADEGLALLAGAGIPWHRVDSFEWPVVEPQQGQFDWTQPDRMVESAERHGVKLVAVLAYTPSWARSGGDRACPPKEPARYWEYVQRCAERYGPRVAAWSIWNEPNLQQFWRGSLTQFVDDVWVNGVNILRNVMPDATIVGPDLSSASNNKSAREWLPVLLRAVPKILNAGTHHQYDGGDTVAGRVKELEKLRPLFGDLPIWVTEIGWMNDPPEKQAALLTETMAAMKARDWWKKTFFYDSYGPGWGLLETESLKPKPAFFAYRDFIASEGSR